ncbi:MAG: hypothetical protein ACTSVE_06700 [Candidatus Helarchaeota archaeon]
MEQPLEERIKIYFDYFAKMIKETLKELGEYFRKKSALPIEVIFQIVVGPETERRLLKQKEIVLKGAQIYDGTEETNQKLVEELFPKYLRWDNHNANLRKRDAKYPEAKEIIKRIFLTRCSIDHEHIKGHGKTYDDIVKTAFKDKVTALSTIGKEFELIDELHDFILHRRRLVNVPGIIRADVIDASHETSRMIKEKIFSEIERVFGN